MGEELLADSRGKKAVDSEIVPFEHVADYARDDHPTRLSKIHIHILPEPTSKRVEVSCSRVVYLACYAKGSNGYPA